MTEIIPRPSSSSTILSSYEKSVLEAKMVHSKSLDLSKTYDSQDKSIMLNAETQGVNKKLMRLAVDSRTSTKRSSLMYDESVPTTRNSTSRRNLKKTVEDVANLRLKLLSEDEDSRFPRIEEMSHFHYSAIEFVGNISVSLCMDESEDITTLDTGQGLLVQVNSGDKSWIIKRSHEDFIGLDRQIHRCLYDRRYSELPFLQDVEIGTKLNEEMVKQMECYLSRFTELAGNNVNCGPILNWLELDNHGNHLVVMEADDSAINVPAIAAGRVIKRYQAQAPDEMTLEVGDFLSVIDMPPVEETIWWRGKKGFEVGFFPSHCVEILGDKDINDRIIAHLQSRPISKRRGKFISFLRFFFKARPSKDELMHSGILRERVFGCDLGERLAMTGRDVPGVLEICSEVIEKHGIVDGIYRLSGIMSNLQSLRMAFDADGDPPNLCDTRYLHDIHCISSLLKTYFRELPNPLFTHELYDKFVAAIGKSDDTEKTVAFHHVIQRLPPPHYRTMNYLLRHLHFVASKADETNMTAKNLAIVWAPNLLRPNLEDSVAALAEFRTQAIIVEYMIRNVTVFFDKNLASAAIAYYPEKQEAVKTLDTSVIARAVPNNTGPKLITLEEARQRHMAHRKVSETVSLGSTASSSPRQNKLRASIVPPKVAATPISPLPTLLSIEEAQARSKPKANVIGRRASVELVKEIKNDIDSPKRSKKWFGLFTKPGKSEGAFEQVISAKSISLPTYLQSDSSPKRSQSEYRITDKSSIKSLGPRASSFGTAAADSELLSPESEDDWKMKPSDGDDSSLMSAIVSVRAKYINIDNNSGSSFAKRNSSIVIGEPQAFRRLDDADLKFIPPKNGYVKRDSTMLEKTKECNSSVEVVRQLKASKLSKEHSYINTEESKQVVDSLKGVVLPPERKHQRQASDDDFPTKKVRSLSPDHYREKTNKEASLPTNTPQEHTMKTLKNNEVSPRGRCSSLERSSQLTALEPKGSNGTKPALNKNTNAEHYQSTKSKSFDHSAVNIYQKSHTRSLSSSDEHGFVGNADFRFERNSSSLYNPKKATSSPFSDSRTRHNVFAFRRLRSHSEEERMLDTLVQQTKSKINTDESQAVVMPKRDHGVRLPSESAIQVLSNRLVNITEKRMDPNFTTTNDEGYVLKQRRLGTTSLTLTTFEKNAHADNGEAHLTTDKLRAANKDYVNVCRTVQNKGISMKNKPDHLFTTEQLSPKTEKVPSNKSDLNNPCRFTKCDTVPRNSPRPRSRSVKECAAMFDGILEEQFVHSSHPNLRASHPQQTPPVSRRPDKRNSQPDVNDVHDFISQVNSSSKTAEASRSYVNINNRHSSYIPHSTHSEPLISRSSSKTLSNESIVNDNRSSSDKLVASSLDRTTETKTFVRQHENARRADRRPKSDILYENQMHYNSAEVRNAQRSSPRPRSIGYSSIDLSEQFPQLSDSASIKTKSYTDLQVKKTSPRTKTCSGATSSFDLRPNQPPPYSHTPNSNACSTADYAMQKHTRQPHLAKVSPIPDSPLSKVDINASHGSAHSLASSSRVVNYDMRRSHSDNRLVTDDTASNIGRQIGRFPLTLRSGSNSRQNVLKSKSGTRPLSMYDNHRGSYYDNVNNIHFEML